MEEIKTNTLAGADSLTLAKAIVAVLIEKKGVDVRLYNAGVDNSVTDYYVNATGRSSTAVLALADEVTYKIGLQGRCEARVEGRSGKSWLLVDYGDVIVNIFDRPSREFYNFDRLMPEDGLVDISDIIEEIDKKYDINVKED
ncbi:MAG: ribosome silencing factor [Ruminococcaceae bacterium]|nr:ribosome silencing factor [Oscillospiraceae bacterium]